MIVYHGSTIEIAKPIVDLGRPNLDFGRGFYVTDLTDQAVRWAKRRATRLMTTAVLNIYDIDIEKVKATYRYLLFSRYDKPWLEFIVANRKGQNLWQSYDVVEGGVANDNVIDTVEDYMNGRMSADAALLELSKHQPNNQICILNQAVIDHYLHFINSKIL
jgi:hypothetical protein